MTGNEKYADLSREALEARLNLAEDICALYGWTGGGPETERDKALLQLWSMWADVVGGSEALSPPRWPHLSDEFIANLAAQRDRIRMRVLSSAFGNQEEYDRG